MKPRHFLDLQGAAVMQTLSFQLTQRAIGDSVKVQAMAAIYGPAGRGKSFAAAHAFANFEDQLDCCWVEFPEEPNLKQIVKTLIDAVTGIEHSGSRYQLELELAAVLAERPRLLVVDEAQRLDRNCFETLRKLHDDTRTKFALVFVGGDDCWDVLSRHPMLESRIWRRVPFRQLSTSEILTVVPSYHPLYEAAEKDLLLLIDDTFAHGNFRRWASFTCSAVDLCQELGIETVTEEVARNVFLLHGGSGE